MRLLHKSFILASVLFAASLLQGYAQNQNTVQQNNAPQGMTRDQFIQQCQSECLEHTDKSDYKHRLCIAACDCATEKIDAKFGPSVYATLDVLKQDPGFLSKTHKKCAAESLKKVSP